MLNGNHPFKNRPAESIGIAAAVAYIILYVLGALEDKLLLASLTVVIGFIPAIVTWIQNQRWRKGKINDRRHSERWSHMNGVNDDDKE